MSVRLQLTHLQRDYDIIKEERDQLQCTNNQKDVTIQNLKDNFKDKTEELEYAMKTLNRIGVSKEFIVQLKTIEEELKREKEKNKYLRIKIGELELKNSKSMRILFTEKSFDNKNINEHDYETMLNKLEEEYNCEKAKNESIVSEKKEIEECVELKELSNQVCYAVKEQCENSVKKEPEYEMKIKKIVEVDRENEKSIKELQVAYDGSRDDLKNKESELTKLKELYNQVCNDMSLEQQKYGYLVEKEQEYEFKLKQFKEEIDREREKNEASLKELQVANDRLKIDLQNKELELSKITEIYNQLLNDMNLEKENYIRKEHEFEIHFKKFEEDIKLEREKNEYIGYEKMKVETSLENLQEAYNVLNNDFKTKDLELIEIKERYNKLYDDMNLEKENFGQKAHEYVTKLKEFEEEINLEREKNKLILSQKIEIEASLEKLQTDYVELKNKHLELTNNKEKYNKICNDMNLEKQNHIKKEQEYQSKIKKIQDENGREKEKNKRIGTQKKEIEKSLKKLQVDHDKLNDDFRNLELELKVTNDAAKINLQKKDEKINKLLKNERNNSIQVGKLQTDISELRENLSELNWRKKLHMYLNFVVILLGLIYLMFSLCKEEVENVLHACF